MNKKDSEKIYSRLLDDAFKDIIPVSVQPSKEVAPFPLEMLPERFRGYVVEMARLKGAPPDYIAVPAVIMLATSLGTRILYQPLTNNEEQRLYPVLWGGIVAESGSNKGAGFETFKPLEEEDTRLREKARIDFEKYEEELAEWKSSKKKGLPVGKKPVEPRKGRMLISSVTTEAIGPILQDNPQGIGLVVNELGQFLRSFGQYKGGKGEDRDTWLSMHDNHRIVADRLGRDPVMVEKPFVNIFGTIQPEKVNKLLLGDNDGLSQRFQLLVYVENDSGAMVNEKMPEDVKKTLHWLAAGMKEGKFGSPIDDGKTYLLTSTEAACKAYMHFDEHTKRMKHAQSEPAIKCHLSKYPFLVARLATVLHCIGVIEKSEGGVIESVEPVSEETMEKAIYLCENYLWPHAQKIYALKGVSEKQARSERIGQYLLNHSKITQIKPRDVRQKCWTGLKEKKDIVDALEHLVLCGWLLRVVKGPGSKGGRTSVSYWVNPTIHQIASGACELKQPEPEAPKPPTAAKKEEEALTIPKRGIARVKAVGSYIDIQPEDTPYMEQVKKALEERRAEAAAVK